MSFKGKKNIYKCDDGHLTVTIDRDDGVTPFMTACPKDGCSLMARSHMYHEQCQVFEPSHEWYRPNAIQMADEARPGVIDHVERGGLLLRRIGASS